MKASSPLPFQKALIARLKKADLHAAAISLRDAYWAGHMFGFGTVPPIENEPPPRKEADRY